ncbi:uncharacterized protein LOC114536521 [Dendronephthya gigantea]|uniref:uncharacterized protein LOC114536521 n=1 Tax=Dendronephthya gigantea TaxID=151771 RepID=UPI00106AC729|nr:uncharacterized protein LOC114536521 [Dendronephthya gigantea]
MREWLVRSVVSSLQNLPAASAETRGSSRNSENRNVNTANEELSERFRLPRGQNRSSARPLPRSGNGRFVPYTTAAKASKSKSKADIIIKDVCLLPSPRWQELPRRHIKQDLINRNLFIDAWSLDKSWSEQQLRSELLNLFKSHLSETTDFEFVKSVGNKITTVKLAEGQEANARIIRHIAGNGPVYIRHLFDIDDEEDIVMTTERTNDIRTFASSDEPSTSSVTNPSTSTV